MSKIKKSKAQPNLKEYELYSSVTSIIDYVKDEVRNTVIEASKQNLIEINEKDLITLTNIVDSTIGAAYSKAAATELSNLYKIILGK